MFAGWNKNPYSRVKLKKEFDGKVWVITEKNCPSDKYVLAVPGLVAVRAALPPAGSRGEPPHVVFLMGTTEAAPVRS